MRVGARLGPFEIVAPLGAGGMGEVYRARDTRLGRDVALKILPDSFGSDPDRLRRFELEARAAAALNHPNILAVYEVGTYDGTPYIVSELLEGQTLRALLSHGPLPPRKAIEYARQIAAALDAVHGRGVVHRDLKPENVFMTTDGRVKLLDFGLAKADGAGRDAIVSHAATMPVVTEPGVILGTAGYMSPEQARGLAADHRSDIFSFGSILYEMLAGRPAFGRASAPDRMAEILLKDPASLSTIAPGTGDPLVRIVERCLQKEPGQRYQHAGEIVAALDTVSSWHTAAPRRVFTPSRSATVIAAGMIVSTVAIAAWFGWLRPNAAAINSLAILPFVNAANNSDTDYLSDGIAGGLINSLSQVPELKVISLGSVRVYKQQQNVDPKAIGRALGVLAVVMGRVAQRGDVLAISVELVDARDRRILWGEQYSRKVADILATQDEISSEIAGKLRLKLTEAGRSRLSVRPTNDREAYELFVKGRQNAGLFTPDGLTLGIDYFERALRKDPRFALAYAWLAQSYVSLEFFDLLRPDEAYRNASSAARKALELDGELAEAHAWIGWMETHYEWNWSGAESDLRRAVRLNPNLGFAYDDYSHLLMAMGRVDESLSASIRAKEVAPLDFLSELHLAWHYYFARQFDESLDHCRKALELEPGYPPVHLFRGWNFEQKKMYAEAVSEFQQVDVPLLGHAYALSGDRNRAQEVLRRWIQRSERAYVSPYAIAEIYVGLGDYDQAFSWLEKAFQIRPSALAYLKMEPRLDAIRSDSRYGALVRRLGHDR